MCTSCRPTPKIKDLATEQLQRKWFCSFLLPQVLGEGDVFEFLTTLKWSMKCCVWNEQASLCRLCLFKPASVQCQSSQMYSTDSEVFRLIFFN